tara:strand:+ start:345 stop:953 length:609 start_codon:yes stop_codon:yes gene_type:complete
MGGDHRQRILDAMGNYFDRIEESSSFREKEVSKRGYAVKKKEKKRNKPRGCRTEYEEHVDIADYLRACGANFIHPNNNARSAIAAKRAGRMGTKKGTADLIVFTSPPFSPGEKGIAIEVKALDGATRVEQFEWLAGMSRDGFLAYVVWGADAGIKLLKELGYAPTRKRNIDGEYKRIGTKKLGTLQIRAVPLGQRDDAEGCS